VTAPVKSRTKDMTQASANDANTIAITSEAMKGPSSANTATVAATPSSEMVVNDGRTKMSTGGSTGTTTTIQQGTNPAVTAPSVTGSSSSTYNQNSGNSSFTYSFQKDANGDTYFYVNGQMQKGLIKLNNEDLYYFDMTTGKMYKGWLTVDGVTYYFAPPSGIALKDGFFTIDGETYNFNKGGALQNGFRKVDDDRYYMDPSTGSIQYGFQEIGGNLYYINPGSGIIETGWFDVGGKTYFASSTGVIARSQKKDCEKKVGGVTITGKYLFGPDGALQSGFVWEGTNLYYYDEDYGRIEEGGPGTKNGGWFNASAGWIYAQDNGKLYYNKTEELPYYPSEKEKDKKTGETKRNYTFDMNGILDE
ncbi:MAG: hypothetical protein IJT32_01720, partial [Lachnospiraceae bacterium]|nr:hypothetical protein [Lachnospiraceae bacterium]